MIELKLHRRPEQEVVDTVVGIVHLLAGEWFTANVPEDTRRDLLFQDVLGLYVDGTLRSFLMFTSWEGAMYITLMGTHPGYRSQGLGTRLMNDFATYTKALGFQQITLLTVPPEVKPVYQETLNFYKTHHFKISKVYREVWNSGAIEMKREL